MSSSARHLRLGVLLSGTGRTLTNLIARQNEGRLLGEVVCVASNKVGVLGLEHAARAGIPNEDFRLSTYFGEASSRDQSMLEWVARHDVDIILLAGYLALLDVRFAGETPVLNIHPALLPKYGGEGFYGNRVHEAVLAAGESESGCSVHLVDSEFDRGRVLAQASVEVLEDDEVGDLAARVFEAECELYPNTINAIARGEIDLTARS